MSVEAVCDSQEKEVFLADLRKALAEFDSGDRYSPDDLAKLNREVFAPLRAKAARLNLDYGVLLAEARQGRRRMS